MLGLNSFSVMAVVFYAAMSALAVGLGMWRGHLEHWFASERPLLDLGLGLSTGLLLVGLTRVSMRHAGMRALSESFGQMLKELRLRDAVVCAIASGIGEEALFRGVIQPEVGVLWASLIFAVIHTGPERKYLWWTLFALGAGYLFGLLASQTGNLIAPMVAHFVVNALNLNQLAHQGRVQAVTADAEAGAAERTDRADAADQGSAP